MTHISDSTTSDNRNLPARPVDASALTGPMQIDVRAVLNAKLGRRARWVPGWAVRMLERVICVPQLNAILRDNYPKTGADFCQGALDQLGVEVTVEGIENLPPADKRGVMFACNHPLGGADGLALIKFMHDYYGGDVYVVVNDILMAVQPLRDVFVPVNKHGAQDHGNARRFDQVLASDNPVLFFPAGLVSRLNDGKTAPKSDGPIADLKWKNTFVNKAIATGRDVVPLYFTGTNSKFFYRFARWRKRLGLKLNIEMVLLPRELMKLRGQRLTIRCGRPIACDRLDGGAKAADTVQKVRAMTYGMRHPRD